MTIDREELCLAVTLNELHTKSLYTHDLDDLDNENVDIKLMLSMQ